MMPVPGFRGDHADRPRLIHHRDVLLLAEPPSIRARLIAGLESMELQGSLVAALHLPWQSTWPCMGKQRHECPSHRQAATEIRSQAQGPAAVALFAVLAAEKGAPEAR